MNWLGEFTSSTKRKIEHFHAIVAQQRQKIYITKCAAVFCRSRCRRRRRYLNPLTTTREEGNTHSIGLWRNTLFKNLTEYWVSEFFTSCFLYITALLQQLPLGWACIRSDPFKWSFARPLSGSFSIVDVVFDVEYHVQHVLTEYFQHVLHLHDAKALRTIQKKSHITNARVRVSPYTHYIEMPCFFIIVANKCVNVKCNAHEMCHDGICRCKKEYRKSKAGKGKCVKGEVPFTACTF